MYDEASSLVSSSGEGTASRSGPFIGP